MTKKQVLYTVMKQSGSTETVAWLVDEAVNYSTAERIKHYQVTLAMSRHGTQLVQARTLIQLTKLDSKFSNVALDFNPDTHTKLNSTHS